MSDAVGGSAPVNPRPRSARGGTVFFMVSLRPLAVFRQARLRLAVPTRPFVEDCPNDHCD